MLRIAALLLAVAMTPAAQAQLATQKSSERGVTVAVTPLNVAPGAKVWEFKIALDTHSQDLADDPAKTTVLVAGGGKPRSALGWEGSAAGGHHREGVVKFAALEPLPGTIELRMRRPGEPAERSFRWQLK